MSLSHDQELELEEMYLNSKIPPGFTSASQIYHQAKLEGLKLYHKPMTVVGMQRPLYRI